MNNDWKGINNLNIMGWCVIVHGKIFSKFTDSPVSGVARHKSEEGGRGQEQ